MHLQEELNKVLQHRTSIYGFLAIWIILFHISSRVDVPGNPRVITPLIEMGNICVDVFLFISGYCVCQSYEKTRNIWSYFKKRINRIIIPYIVFGVPLYLWKNFVETHGVFSIKAFIGDIVTYNFWIHGMQTTWFVCAILLFYMITPFLFLIIKNGKKTSVCLIVTIFIMNILAFIIWPLYRKSSICWTRLPVYVLGMITYCYLPASNMKNESLICKILITITFLLMVIFPFREIYTSQIGSAYEFMFLGYILLIPGLCIILGEVFDNNHIKGYQLFVELGKLSLELYIIHVFLLRIFDYFSLSSIIGISYYILIPGLSIAVVKIYELLRRKLNTRTN